MGLLILKGLIAILARIGCNFKTLSLIILILGVTAVQILLIGEKEVTVNVLSVISFSIEWGSSESLFSQRQYCSLFPSI